ncbi:MAG TPA: hypothetical protein VGC01_09400 [Mucilaginibacter sp.]
MKKIYSLHVRVLTGLVFLLAFVASCKKDSKDVTPAAPTNYATIGLYEYANATNRRAYVPITKVGTVTTAYLSIFDTGSTGMTIDADGLLPASMITSNGITVTGDSVVVNGITVTSQQATISYGGVGGITKEYGNLAYASVVMGDANGKVTASRIPFFLYYKAVDGITGKTLPTHSNDVFGVGPGTSATSSSIASPLSYFKLAPKITNGFKLAMFNNGSFSTTTPTYVSGLLTIGLTPNDLSSSGFIMHPMLTHSGAYYPDIAGTINYNGTNVAAEILFDTGTPSISILEDAAATSNITTLPAGTNVIFTTANGFSYTYTTTSNYNLTQVERPSYSLDIRTIFSIDFFISNEYLLDYTNHKIGLKNN